VDSDRGIPLGRAAFFGTIAAGIGGIALASRFSGAVSSAMSGVAGAIPVVKDIAPTEGWRIYAVNPPMPVFDPATFRLEITGLVAEPRTLTWEEVAALPTEPQVSDFHCVTGWSVNDVRWEGIRPSTLLDLCRPAAAATHVTFFSSEHPYMDQLTLDQFTEADVMLATQMDGRPVPRAHGAPLRLVVPRMYGYKGVKWVNAIRFDPGATLGYWEQRGYDVDAWVGDSNGL
jgi:DMSO/TMAO reductase YedYZ molybdopterin-dependent catalytic subunit